MKRRKSLWIILSIALFLSTVTAFADIKVDLKGHWVERVIDKSIVEAHFKYLIKDSTISFNPDFKIDKKNFMLSLYTMISTDKDSSTEKLNDKAHTEKVGKYLITKKILEGDSSLEGKLTRKEAVKYMIKTLELSKEIQLTDTNYTPYKDILGLDDTYKRYILKANMIGLIKGYGDSSFRPEEDISISETIVLLQELKKQIEESTSIPYKIVEEKTQKDTISTKEKGDKVLVTISKEFPTSGYNMGIKRVEKYAEGKYRVHLDIKAPEPNRAVLQVITQIRATIEIDKKSLDKKYTFEIAQ